MVLRLFILGMLIALAYRLVRDFFRAVFRSMGQQQSRPPETKKPPWDLDKTRIKDAEFRDLDP